MDRSTMLGVESEQASGENSQSEHTRLQMIWDKQMEKGPATRRYRKVTALLLSWEAECDDLSTKKEVCNENPQFRICAQIRGKPYIHRDGFPF